MGGRGGGGEGDGGGGGECGGWRGVECGGVGEGWWVGGGVFRVCLEHCALTRGVLESLESSIEIVVNRLF